MLKKYISDYDVNRSWGVWKFIKYAEAEYLYRYKLAGMKPPKL